MAQAIRVAILGAGWPGVKHAEGYKAAGGYEVVAVADRIPSRRRAIMALYPGAREMADAADAVRDVGVDAVSVCLPNDLHAPIAVAALKAGKHVLCETPPATNAADAKRMAAAAAKAQKTLMYAAQRRFGGAEQAADQAIVKGYAGEPYHARASWMRTRGIPAGTAGWYTDRSKSGGGAMIDLGVQMLDLAWRLLGQPTPLSAYAVAHQRFAEVAPPGAAFDVEDAAFALLKFEGGKSLELAASWAINQSPRRHGTACRVYGDRGAVEVYTPQGAVLFRSFGSKGESKEVPLKLPKLVHYPAMMRHFRNAIANGTPAAPGAADGLALMRMVEAIYRSVETGRSADVKQEPSRAPAETPAAVEEVAG